MERERKHWEHEIQSKNSALEDALLRAKKLDTENHNYKNRIAELDQEMLERDACEAQVQEYVKQLLEEKAKM